MPTRETPHQRPSREAGDRVVKKYRLIIYSSLLFAISGAGFSAIQPKCSPGSPGLSGSIPSYSKRFYNAEEFEKIAKDLFKKRSPKKRAKKLRHIRAKLKKYPGSVFDTDSTNVLTKAMQKVSFAHQDGDRLGQINPCDVEDKSTIGSFLLVDTPREEFKKINEEVKQAIGRCLPITSVFRQGTTQDDMRSEGKGKNPDAIVGSSNFMMHGMGQAVDVGYLTNKEYRIVRKIFLKHGWVDSELADCGHFERRKGGHSGYSKKCISKANWLVCQNEYARKLAAKSRRHILPLVKPVLRKICN